MALCVHPVFAGTLVLADKNEHITPHLVPAPALRFGDVSASASRRSCFAANGHRLLDGAGDFTCLTTCRFRPVKRTCVPFTCTDRRNIVFHIVIFRLLGCLGTKIHNTVIHAKSLPRNILRRNRFTRGRNRPGCFMVWHTSFSFRQGERDEISYA